MVASDLPVELWHRIASYCTKPDLRALRLCCRGVAAVADEWFMRDITIFFVRDDFDFVEEILHNPRVANNVRIVHFQADCIPGTASYREWDMLRRNLAEMDTRPKAATFTTDEVNELCSTSRGRRLMSRESKRRVALETRKHSKASLKAAYEHYTSLFLDQIDLVKGRRAQACLHKVFEACPKLEAVFVILRDDASPEVRSWRASQTLLSTMIEPYGDSTSLSIGLRPVNETMLAASSASRKLQQLEMSPVSYQFFKQPQHIMDSLYSVVSGTERLRITINDRFQTDREVSLVEAGDLERQLLLSESPAEAAQRVLTSFSDGRLAKFLSHATSLRYLALVPPGEVQWWPGQLRLKDIVGDMTWPNLKTLGLCNFMCEAPELTDLMLRHGNTLDDIGLGHVEFVEGSWRECLDSFAGKLPHLRIADLHGTFRDSASLDGPLRLSCYCGQDVAYGPHVLCNFTRQVNSYIVHGGEFPETPEPEILESDDATIEGLDGDDELSDGSDSDHADSSGSSSAD